VLVTRLLCFPEDIPLMVVARTGTSSGYENSPALRGPMARLTTPADSGSVASYPLDPDSAERLFQASLHLIHGKA